ncbi:transposable element-derived 1-like [Octopus vulgaris]|uniref:Transposable element-derived 1-like n=1 Tax=Octopus vulgaris TaxID=6645 RepID=A0AA36AI74_OCTVU|nr:transposable element-derived 1-like [Octopus vulgaris]
MDETGLFRKKIPSRTYIMKDETRAPAFKAQKDRVMLITCHNAAGFMMNPRFNYKSSNPRAFKNKNKNLLPVHWMYNSKAWITKSLTLNWFHQCFIPQAKEYLQNVCMEFKVLLVMDNAGGHSLDLNHKGVQAKSLPANTNSLIQPMDQGMIRAYKALYTWNSLQHLVNAMDSDENFELKEYWCNFTITTCLSVIHAALKDMKGHVAVNNAVKQAKVLSGEGFHDVTQDEVNDLINAHSETLTDEAFFWTTSNIRSFSLFPGALGT